jgi:hypothetical protein
MDSEERTKRTPQRQAMVLFIRGERRAGRQHVPNTIPSFNTESAILEVGNSTIYVPTVPSRRILYNAVHYVFLKKN